VVESVIILAAGQSAESGGYPNILIQHPVTRKTVLDHALEAFKGKKITVVVGHKALQIIDKYPDLNYVLNHQWGITKNSYSLGLALSEEPTYVVSGDIFIGEKLIQRLESLEGDFALTEHRENRSISSINCILDSNGAISSTYQGPIQDSSHPEAIGLYRVSDPEVLSIWRSRCLRHNNLHAGQLLPADMGQVLARHIDKNEEFHEVNSAEDYLNLVKALAARD
jgi:choline kinase